MLTTSMRGEIGLSVAPGAYAALVLAEGRENG
jgi:hypothetical protein